jgi:hypothetical protein
VANNLTAGQTTAFTGGTIDLSKFERRVRLISSLGATTEITSRCNRFNSTRVSSFNVNPAQQGDLEFPTMKVDVVNGDGYFTPGRTGNVFGSDPPSEFGLRFTIADLLTDPTGATLLVDFTFQVNEVRVGRYTAELFAVHRLARFWSETWQQSDGDFLDWNGFSNSFFMR